MDRSRSFVLCLVLAFQALMSRVEAQSDLIGYTVSDSTTSTFYCPDDAVFSTGITFSGDPWTYAHCDHLATMNDRIVGLSCDGTTAIYTDYGGATDSTDSRICSNTCLTVSVYASYDGGSGSGLQYMISCDDWILSSGEPATVFVEDPSDWDTTATTTDDDDTTTTATDPTTTDRETSTTTTSEPTRTDDPDPDDKGGASAGVIAGAVVGSVAGVALIACALVLGFRMGRRNSGGDPEMQPKGFRDTLRSLPRPAITWTSPDKGNNQGHVPVAVSSPTFAQDAANSPPGELPAEPTPHVGVSGTPAPPYQQPVYQQPVYQQQPTAIESQPFLGGGTPGAELPAGPDAQGWAGTQDQAQAYEMDPTPSPRSPAQ
ncbi:hypothetical protein ACJ41O_015071 [Fusarium nematophilum]